MLQTMFNTVVGLGQGKLRMVLASGAVLAGVAGLPSAVLAAHHRDGHFEVVVPAPEVVVPCDPAPAQVWVEPTYRTVTDREWVAPVYQTVTDRVWVPAGDQTQTQQVQVPAVYEWRDVAVRDFWGRQHFRREQVLISPAHTEDRQVTVYVPAHFEDQSHQVLVTDGHWQDVTRQEVVTPGHFEPVVQPARVEIRLPF